LFYESDLSGNFEKRAEGVGMVEDRHVPDPGCQEVQFFSPLLSSLLHLSSLCSWPSAVMSPFLTAAYSIHPPPSLHLPPLLSTSSPLHLPPLSSTSFYLPPLFLPYLGRNCLMSLSVKVNGVPSTHCSTNFENLTPLKILNRTSTSETKNK
jgi:hypothetical protein